MVPKGNHIGDKFSFLIALHSSVSALLNNTLSHTNSVHCLWLEKIVSIEVFGATNEISAQHAEGLEVHPFRQRRFRLRPVSFTCFLRAHVLVIACIHYFRRLYSTLRWDVEKQVKAAIESGKATRGDWEAWRGSLLDQIAGPGLSPREKIVVEVLCFFSSAFLEYQRVSVWVTVRGRFVPDKLTLKVTNTDFPWQ